MTGAAGGGAPETDDRTIRLSDAEIGAHGVIVGVRADPDLDIEVHGVTGEELERRLLEFGFVEGARIELLHEGAIGKDPIAVRLDDMRVALRRRDANDVYVRLDDPA